MTSSAAEFIAKPQYLYATVEMAEATLAGNTRRAKEHDLKSPWLTQSRSFNFGV
jgi:hypothetical protein